ncbi:MAG: glycosyltransferase family 39 protein [Planctomycetota bacterium]|nr:glycosyltransferase family 39 protein [Planctomycetota bacterium]
MALVVGALLLVFLPTTLRLWPIGHGLPHNYLPDTHIVRGALGMARDKDPFPPAGRYSTYPNLLQYALLPVYAVQYGCGLISGEWAGPDEFGDRLLEEPQLAHIPARYLVELIGALTTWVVFLGARAAGLRGGAWVAAWLVATGLLHLHFSVQERPWVPLCFFLALAAWPAALYAESGRARHLFLSGAAAGLAFATHQGGLAAIGIPALAWAFGPLGWSGADLKSRLVQGVGSVALFGGLALALGYPALLVHGAAEEVAGPDQGQLEIGGQQFVFGFRAASFTRLSKAFFGYDPVLVLLLLAGLVPALRAKATRAATLFACLWAALFMTSHNDHVRYLLPLAVLFTWAAGMAAERLWSLPRARWVLVPLLALPLVQALRLGWVLRQPDTRATAADALARLSPGARTAIDCYGPVVPLSLASLERIAAWRELYAREAHRREVLAAGADTPEGPGLDALRIEDLFDYEQRHRSTSVKAGREHLGDDPNAILRNLGVTHVLLVDRNPEDDVPPLLTDAAPSTDPEWGKLPPLALDPEPVFVVDPARDGAAAAEARLPTELDFPLTSLWRVARPGPRMELHRLP